jgi:hypothetical protein
MIDLSTKTAHPKHVITPEERAYKRLWYKAHRESVIAKAQEYYQNNRERRIRQAVEWSRNNPVKRNVYKTNWNAANRDKVRATAANSRVRHHEKILIRQRAKGSEYQRNSRRNNPVRMLEDRLRARLQGAVRRGRAVKRASVLTLIGCTARELCAYLESRFLQGMTWGNRRLWHIDHVRPCASFDLTDLEQQKVCFHYTNLQPLWAADNIRKGGRFDRSE